MKKSYFPRPIHVISFTLSIITFLLLPASGFSFTKGDITNNGKVGLPEAIYALSVAADLRMPLTITEITVRPDGSGDFTTIQAAIDAAAEGDVIDIGEGTFEETLNIANKRLELKGAGMGNTIIKGGGNETEDAVIFAINSSGIIRDLTVRDGKFGLEITASRIGIVDCGFEENSVGIHARRTSTINLSQTIVRDNASYGAEITGSSSAFIENNCEFSNNEGDGLRFLFGSSGFISNSSFIDNNGGINFSHNSTGQVYGCTISHGPGKSGEGIIAYANCSVWIHNTSVSNSPRHGIFAMSGSSVTLVGSTVENSAEHGVLAYINSTARLIGGNTITGNGTWGALAVQNSSLNIALDLTYGSEKDDIFGNTSGGVVIVASSSGLLESAIIRENGPTGLHLAQNSHSEVRSAVIISGHHYGIHYSQNSTLVNNGDVAENKMPVFCFDCPPSP